MENAFKSDKPIKLRNFTETINEFENKPLLKLGEQSEIEFSTQKLPFEKVKELVKQSNSFTKISEISNISVGELVNMEVFVDIENSPITQVNTKYGVKRKRDAFINDDSSDETLRFTIWNNIIESFPKSGVFKVKDVRINSFNGKYITTTAGTVALPSTKAIQKKKSLVIMSNKR